ncbi:hypothetical protein [uncultured Tateyamaria sp.]|uniref:hypothetical protein n=1 Tax=uncultured Tateyamaria sp. TaxID=455651 RepID=UPI002628B0BB|nr:hypothetical protein [uncultured Tateyamaria sp.]
MGWWREKSGDLIGDGPADRIADLLSGDFGETTLSLATILASLDSALRRNPAQFVTDPQNVGGELAAHDASSDAVIWQAHDAPYALVERCHETLEAIAMDYLDNSLEALPTCSEVLSNVRFALVTHIPTTVTAPPGFDLHRIAYMPGTRCLVRDVTLACVKRIAGDFGLTQDRDAVAQIDPPAFASWTRHPDLGLEVDWHADAAGVPHVEIRGHSAPRLAHALQKACGGRIVQDPEAALTELLTVPPRAAPANASAAQLRWEALCAAITSDGISDDMAARALVSASLADSDWRIRIAALWAVGHHRMKDLGPKAQGAALPTLDYAGLGQEDRRVLLCLRDLATARSAGLSEPLKKGADRGFVTMVGTLLNDVPQQMNNRAAALVCAVLRQPLPAGFGAPPTQWQAWMATR